MTDRVLTTRELNRALLARQLLLERATLAVPEAADQVGGLQTQYAPSGYVGLWTRLVGFRRDDLTGALEDRSVVQGTLMRTTIHMVSRREYWLYAMGVRRARRAWALKVTRDTDEAAWVARATRLREALRDGPRSVKELGGAGAGFVGNLGLWVDLVRVPPSGTWERRRADILGLAEDWVGACDATEDEGLAHLVRAYLRGVRPVPVARHRLLGGDPADDGETRREGGLQLARYRDADGRVLVDLPGAPLPGSRHAGSGALPRPLGRRGAGARPPDRPLPEAHRPRVFSDRNPFSVGTCLVDGRVVGAWTVRDGRIALDVLETLGRRDRDAVEEEREALEVFHA